MKRLLLATLLIHTAQAEPIGFAETFVLADTPAKREAALATLVPGSEDALYYRALHLEHSKDWPALREHLEAWRQTKNHLAKLKTCELRLALHTIDEPASLEKIRDTARPGPPHLPPASAAAEKLPTSLDPSVVSADAFLNEAIRTNNIGSLTNYGIRTLLASDLGKDLSAAQRQPVLDHEELSPEIPGLYELIVADLADKSQQRTFGQSSAHGILTLDQLADLRRALPDLANQQEYVHTVIRKLRPPQILPLYGPPAARETRKTYLDAALKFALPLSPAFSSLKAHLLFHRLKVDESAGTRDLDRFLEYLALPRPTRYASKSYLSSNRGLPVASLKENFTEITGFRAVNNDDALIRALLIYFLQDERTTKRFTKYFSEEYLRPLHAEARVLAGKSKPEDFMEALTPAQFTALRDRIDLEFAHDAPTVFTPGDEVTLPLLIKNIPHIDVRIFELDPLAIYEANGTEIEPQIDLSGLAPTAEFRIDTTADSPFLQRRISPDLPDLLAPGKRGAWVVDVVGSGRSCRALVRKGQLLLTEVKSTPAGQELTITDASGKPVSPAVVRLSGSEFESDEDTGKILLPYTTSPGSKPIVLVDPKDGFASLASFNHSEENPYLTLDVQSTRAALVPGLTGSATIAPTLRIGNEPAPLGLCTDLTLSISGGGTSLSVPLDPESFAAPGATQHVSFTVPANADDLIFKLGARIENVSTGENVELKGTERVTLASKTNSAAPTPILTPTADGKYSLLLAGRNFEPYSGYPFSIAFHSTYGWKTLSHEFATDENGRVSLGDLVGIRSISILGYDLKIEASYKIAYPEEIFATTGEPISIPLVPGSPDPTLYSFAAGEYIARYLPEAGKRDADRFTIRTLAPGEYFLFTSYESGSSTGIMIQVSPAPGVPSNLSIPQSPSPQLAFSETAFSENGDLTVSLKNTTPDTRLSFTTSPFFGSSDLHRPGRSYSETLPLPILTSRFLSGRKLGGEERYVLDRRTLPAFAGSLAPLPGVLINPWVIAESQAQAQEASDAEEWDEEVAQPQPSPAPKLGARRSVSAFASDSGLARQEALEEVDDASPSYGSSSLRFLAASSTTGSDLRPDDDGKITIPAVELGNDSVITLFATDTSNGSSISFRITRGPEDPGTRDLRLAKPLSENPVARELTERVIAAGETLTFPDALSADPKLTFTVAEFFEDLAADVPAIAPFRILGRWDKLDAGEKQETYDRLASHELHLFLSRKDPEFFKSVVAPYLRNKLQKTFIDLYLLNRDLSNYHELANFEKLNAAEKALLAQRSPEHRDAIVRRIAEEDTLLAGSNNVSETARFGGIVETDGFSGDPFSDSPSIVISENRVTPLFSRPRASASKRQTAGRQRLFQAVTTTKEWAESNYYQRKRTEPSSDCISSGDFWVDLAKHDAAEPFLSAKNGGIVNSLHSALFALALNELPFAAGEKTTATNSVSCTTPFLTRYLADSPLEVGVDTAPLTLRQAVLLRGRETAVSPETPLVVGSSYTLLTVVTNSTPEKLEGRVVTQIPTGAIAISGNATQTKKISLDSFASAPLVLDFYFPIAGEFAIAPAHASDEKKHLGSSEGWPVKVLPEPPAPDPNSWSAIAANGSPEAVLTYLEEANLSETDFSLAAWRARADAEFFDKIVSLLEKRHFYSGDIYRYALEHIPVRKAALASYLQQSPNLLQQTGTALQTGLFTTTPFLRHTGELEDFFPLVPARAHTLDGTPSITNPAFHSYYHEILEEMAELPERSGRDHLVLSTALLAQRRIADAMEQFLMIPTDDAVAGTVQFAYLRAVIALHQADGEMARTVAGQYSDYPVKRWRERFNTVLAHAGGTPDAGETPEASQDAIADELPSLAFSGLTLKHQNTASAMLHIHEMDVELLFSAAPFPDSGDAGKRFRTVRPTATVPLEFDEASGIQEIVLPESFDGKDVHLTVTSGSASATTTRLRNHFDIAATPTYGRLQVTAGAVPLSKVYVKAYARHADGTVRFHKDGNTDLRGKFDYATTTDLSGNNSPVTGYALLVLSDSHGAKILQVAPPTK